MNPLYIPILALLIPVIAMLGKMVVQPWFELRRRELELQAEAMSARYSQDTGRTERLEQRVAVLERLLTDRSTTLADEIDRLRDKPLN